MITKTEFINKWSTFWMLQKQGAELTAAFEKELNALIEQGIASSNLGIATSPSVQNSNNATGLLPDAAIWWKRLSPLKRELFESKYGNINDEKINEIYKIHTDWSNEDLERFDVRENHG